MKKLGKFIFGTISVAALAGGVFYFFKNVLNKDSSDDFDDFEDDFDDFDMDNDEEEVVESEKKDTREYVKLNLDETDVKDETLSNEATTDETLSMDDEISLEDSIDDESKDIAQ